MNRSTLISIVVLAVSGTSLFTFLLVHGQIGEVVYLALVALLALLCSVLPGFSRLRELDLRNLRLTLDRIEEVKEEVFAKEADLRNIAISLAKIIAFGNAFQGRYKSEEGIQLERNWYLLQTNKLLDLLAVDRKVRQEILKYDTFYQTARSLKAADEKERFAQHLYNMVRADLRDNQPQKHSKSRGFVKREIP